MLSSGGRLFLGHSRIVIGFGSCASFVTISGRTAVGNHQLNWRSVSVQAFGVGTAADQRIGCLAQPKCVERLN